MKLVSKSNKNKDNGNTTSGAKNTVTNTNSNDAAGRVKNPAATVNKTAAPRNIDTVTKPKRKKKSHILTIVIIVLVIALGFSAFFISLGFYVDSLDTIFPNVWAEGIKLSGMTFDEAVNTLIAEGYESNAEGISATVIFPDGERFSVNGEEVGLSFDAKDAAIAAFAFGRGGTFFENEVTYLRSLFDRTDLYDLSTPVFDDTIVHELAAEYTVRFNETLMDSNLEVSDDSITIIKGTGIHPAEEKEVFDLAILTLLRAIDEHEHLTATYIPERNTDDYIDLQMLFDHIHVDPITARWDVESGRATMSKAGKSFNVEAAMEKLNNAEYGSTIVIPIFALLPEYTQEEIESMIFRDILAESKTNITGNTNRLSNIALTARLIHETVLNPGDIFSFNEVVGARTAERGFLPAPVFIGGRLEDGIGGGICQTSSTIYDAVLHTHLEVVERRAHGMMISYLPLGNDATVVFVSNTDFRFKNNTDFPLRIETTVSGRELHVKLIGTKLDDTYIEIETVSISTTPFTVIEREDNTIPLGETEVFTSGIAGHVVDTFQLHYSADGELISRTLVGRSTYRVQDRVILIGTMEPEATPPPPDPTPSPSPSPDPSPTPSPEPPPDPPPDPPPGDD